MKININDVIDRIDLILKARNLSRNEMAAELGFNAHQFIDWKYRQQVPGSERLYTIAKYLGVTFEYLIEGNELDDDAAVIMSYVLGIPKENRKAVIAMVKSQYDLYHNPSK